MRTKVVTHKQTSRSITTYSWKCSKHLNIYYKGFHLAVESLHCQKIPLLQIDVKMYCRIIYKYIIKIVLNVFFFIWTPYYQGFFRFLNEMKIKKLISLFLSPALRNGTIDTQVISFWNSLKWLFKFWTRNNWWSPNKLKRRKSMLHFSPFYFTLSSNKNPIEEKRFTTLKKKFSLF